MVSKSTMFLYLFQVSRTIISQDRNVSSWWKLALMPQIIMGVIEMTFQNLPVFVLLIWIMSRNFGNKEWNVPYHPHPPGGWGGGKCTLITKFSIFENFKKCFKQKLFLIYIFVIKSFKIFKLSQFIKKLY